MKVVDADTMAKDFAVHAETAVHEPLGIVRDGPIAFVLLSGQEYRRLRQFDPTREDDAITNAELIEALEEQLAKLPDPDPEAYPEIKF